MKKTEIVKGRRYALRSQDAGAQDGLVKVTYVGPVRGGQIRVRYEQGELHGLDEWVPTRLLACRWGERAALLRDEEHATRLAAADEEVWDRVEEGRSAP